MSGVYIAGAAMTQFGKFPDSTIRSLAGEATKNALADAGIKPEQVQIAFFSNATAGILTGQEMIRGQVALRETGLLGIPIVNVENACASASSAVFLAAMAVRAGAADVALAVGAEKLTHEDKTKSFAAIGTAVDLFQLDQLRELTRQSQRVPAGSRESVVASPLPQEADADGSQRSFFMDIYAANSRAYMESSGATPEDFAKVAVKSHKHAALNPKAQYRKEVTVEEVLASREIAYPLTLLMCSPIGDGGAAIVVCSEDFARRLNGDAVRILSTTLVSGRDRTDGEPSAAQRAAKRAYEEAGVGP
ncbi:MAG: thiolase family protein, partial [Actinomycetota bacterium]|nr:thiolase family protein [Actinomycetota bacterium]